MHFSLSKKWSQDSSIYSPSSSITLNNEKIFEECDIIFLCIQPMQLDLLSKEIFQVFSERIEKLTKREYKCYPLIISFLSATPIKRLEMFFPKKVHITRTRLLYNFLRSKKKPLFSGSNVIEEDGEYIEESCDHLLDKDKCIEILENLIDGLTHQFYTELFIKKNNNNKSSNKEPLFLFEIIFGKDLAVKYYDLFKLEEGKFIITNQGENNGEKKEINNKNDIGNNNDNEDEEKMKNKKEFCNRIGNDFKNIYISYLDKLIK